MIGAGALVTNSVIGPGARIGGGAVADSIVAARVQIDDDRSVAGERVFLEVADGA